MGLLNLPAIEASLRRVQREFDTINRRLSSPRDPMSDTVIENVLAGYAYLNVLHEDGINVFAKGQHKYLLELNNRVLCGTDPALRLEFAPHIQATQTRFYEEPHGGIEDLVEWCAAHRNDSVWKRAAGTYVRSMSKPQLFIEGNHRTGTLLASSILLNAGQPPFVLTVENAVAYFEPSTVIRNTSKLGPMALFRLPGIKKRFAKFLEQQADPSYLLSTQRWVAP